MSKFGLYSEKSPIPFEIHLGGLDDEATKILLDLRTFVTGLGKNVIEEVRPHRIIYAKSLTFRTFLDIQPNKDSLIIAIKKSRHESAVQHTIRSFENLQSIKFQIATAYERIK